MNKMTTLLLINIGLIFNINVYAAVQESIDSDSQLNHAVNNINQVIIDINDEMADKVELIELLLAGNTYNQDTTDITGEIDEINKEMSEIGKEFGHEMKQMGKELQDLVKMLRKMGDKESGKGAFLGILLDDHEGVDEGILLLGVTPEGPAQKAGLQADDVITQINDDNMARTQHKSPAKILRKTMKSVNPGEIITLIINRNGDERKIILKAGKRGEHLQSGINFLADDLEKRINKKIHIEMDYGTFSEIELYPVNAKLGNYFGSDNGMLILNIPENNKFKLQQGDVILKIGDRSPKTTAHTWRILESYDSGENINFTLMRNKLEIQTSITKP